MMNTHLRDNTLLLKVPLNDSGKIVALSSSYLADLSGTNLTGLAVPGSGNTITAGKTSLNGGSTVRMILPVGADLWTGTKGVDAKGMWVEGDYLHHIAVDYTTEWRYLGTVVTTPAGAVAGSFWIESTVAHYIDASGVERTVNTTLSGHGDAAASGLWVETYVHWIQEAGTTERVGHSDVTHSDGSTHTDHNDHDDTGTHYDSTTHGDTSSHDDYWSPSHEDHYDLAVHVDIPGTHYDTNYHTDHSDHSDSGPHTDHNDHNDTTTHSDVAADSRPVVVT